MFLAAVPGSTYASDPPTSDKSDKAFEQLKSLAGTWKLVMPKSAKQVAFRISYRIISRGTALVETFGDPMADVTETIYHLDGRHLMLTHYCAQGNQPRLRLAADSAANKLHFEFQDATNLRNLNDSHLVDLRFEFEPGGYLRREETYRENGQDDRSVLLLEPIPAT
jgi:hypothetical protein